MLQIIKDLHKNYSNKLFCIFLIIIFVFNFFIFSKALADQQPDPLDILDSAGEGAGYSITDNYNDMLNTTIGLIIAVILGFLGVIFLVIIIYSGFQWMTAGGNEETVAKAKKRLTNAMIGLIIVISGFVISYFVVTQLSNITTSPSGPGSGP